MRYLTQALDIHGAEAGIEPSSLSLKIKEIFKFENFCTSMCTLTGLPMVRLERSGVQIAAALLAFYWFRTYN
jgi:hypothetical protein